MRIGRIGSEAGLQESLARRTNHASRASTSAATARDALGRPLDVVSLVHGRV
jgi:hypothetical protein